MVLKKNIKNSENLRVDFIRSENVKSNEKHEMNHTIPIVKNQNDFPVLLTFLPKTKILSIKS